MKKNQLQIGLALVLLMLAAGGGVYLLRTFWEKGDSAATRPIRPEAVPPSGSAAKQKQTVYLYFSDEENMHLVSEDRILFATDDPVEIGKMIVHDLIQGPKGRLVRTIPAGTRLNALYISQNGTAFLDFSDAIREQHPGGSATELLTVYSIVNSVVLNIPQVRNVKILIGGRETLTLAGHIDITTPLTANMMLIR